MSTDDRVGREAIEDEALVTSVRLMRLALPLLDRPGASWRQYACST